MAEMAKMFTAPQIEESYLAHTYLHNVCVSVPPKNWQKVAKNGKKWQKMAKAAKVATVSNSCKRLQKVARSGKNWQKVTKVAESGKKWQNT